MRAPTQPPGTPVPRPSAGQRGCQAVFCPHEAPGAAQAMGEIKGRCPTRAIARPGAPAELVPVCSAGGRERGTRRPWHPFGCTQAGSPSFQAESWPTGQGTPSRRLSRAPAGLPRAAPSRPPFSERPGPRGHRRPPPPCRCGPPSPPPVPPPSASPRAPRSLLLGWSLLLPAQPPAPPPRSLDVRAAPARRGRSSLRPPLGAHTRPGRTASPASPEQPAAAASPRTTGHPGALASPPPPPERTPPLPSRTRCGLPAAMRPSRTAGAALLVLLAAQFPARPALEEKKGKGVPAARCAARDGRLGRDRGGTCRCVSAPGEPAAAGGGDGGRGLRGPGRGVRGSGLPEALATFLLSCPRARGGGRPGTCVPGPGASGRAAGVRTSPRGPRGLPAPRASPRNPLAGGSLPGVQLQPGREAECGSLSLTPCGCLGGRGVLFRPKWGARTPELPPGLPRPPGPWGLVQWSLLGTPRRARPPHPPAPRRPRSRLWVRGGAGGLRPAGRTAGPGAQLPGDRVPAFFFFFANFPPRDPEFLSGGFFSLSEDSDIGPTKILELIFGQNGWVSVAPVGPASTANPSGSGPVAAGHPPLNVRNEKHAGRFNCAISTSRSRLQESGPCLPLRSLARGVGAGAERLSWAKSFGGRTCLQMRIPRGF